LRRSVFLPERVLRRSRGSGNPASFARTRHWNTPLGPRLRGDDEASDAAFFCPNARSVVPAEAGTQRLSPERALRRSRGREPSVFRPNAPLEHATGSPPSRGRRSFRPSVFRPNVRSVVPAEAGTQRLSLERATGIRHWVSAFAGTTKLRDLQGARTGSPPSRGDEASGATRHAIT